MNGPVVVISGAPAAGKTTLGRPLARHLGWPLISKDVIKESLYDELGNPRSRRRSKRMGQAAFEILYALLNDMPTAVIETHWHPDISGPRLRGLDRPVVEICCQCDRQVRLARLGSRPRHPGHLESRLKLMPSWIKQRMPLGFEEPLDLGGPLLRLETTEPIDIAVVARWVEANVANEAAVR